MHGAAQLIGDQLFVTNRDADSEETGLSQVVERYSLSEGAFSFEQRYETLCPSLHGSDANEDYLVFGCSDGVLSIDLNDENYAATKLSNPESLAEGKRISTVITHFERSELIGIASGQLFIINPANEIAITELELPENAGSRVLQGMDAHGERLYVITDDGDLHVYDAENSWELIDSLENVVSTSESGVSVLTTVSAAEEILFVFDKNEQELILIDIDGVSVLGHADINLDISSMVWLGLADHDEDHDHDHNHD